MIKLRSLHVLTILIIFFGLISSATGLFYLTGGKTYDFVNQYGATIRMYGDGLYARDSYFMAPIFRGTDFTILVMALPMLITGLIFDIRKRTLRSHLYLIAVIAVFTYYSTSLAFGVTYNILHLIYIAFFSVSLFGLINGIGTLDRKALTEKVTNTYPKKGYIIFLALTGVVLIVAWLPDIILSLAEGKPLAMIEVYTTSITNVLDMGIIGPVALMGIYQLRKKSGIGYIILGILFTVCIIIGVMVPMQTLYQFNAGIDTSLPVLITKIGSFMIMAPFALYFNIRLFRSIKG